MTVIAPAAPTRPIRPPREPRPRRSSPWWVLAVVGLGQLTVVLDVTIVNIALPAAQHELGMSDAARGAVITVYALAFGSLLLLGGRIADFWGRKRSFLLGLAGFALASALGGLATSELTLLLARGLQGAFAALLAPAGLALLSITFPSGRDRIRAFAVYGVIGGGGAAAGLVLGGVLTQYLSWRWCLLVNVPIAAVVLLLAAPVLPSSVAAGRSRYDLPGAVLVTVGLGTLVLGCTRAEHGWVRADTLGLLGLGIGLLLAFVLVERRARSPLLPLRILTDRVRAAAFATSLIIGTALLGAILYLAFYFQSVRGMTPLEAAVASLPMTAAIVGTAPLATRLLGTIGPRIMLAVGPLVAAAGLLWLSRITLDGRYWIDVLPGQVLLGVGLAVAFAPLSNLALAAIDPRDAGVAGAALTATQQIGGSMGTAVFTALYSSTVARVGGAGEVTAIIAGQSMVFLAAALALALISPLAWLLVDIDRHTFLALGSTGGEQP